MQYRILQRRVRLLLALFVIATILSGFTAVPLQWELDILQNTIGEGTSMEKLHPPMAAWISRVHAGLTDVSENYPFLYYGTDWLAFGIIIIAIAFCGPLRDPVKNVWVVQLGMIACILVIPTALICGHFRGIPFFWRLIDCSFGILGIIPLALCTKYIRQMDLAATA